MRTTVTKVALAATWLLGATCASAVSAADVPTRYDVMSASFKLYVSAGSTLTF